MKYLIGLGVAGLVAIVLALSSFSIIGAGQRGVVLHLGAVEDRVMPEGINFKTPFLESVVKLDVKTLKEQVEVTAASSDLQTVTVVVALNYHLQPDRVNKL